MLDKFLSVSCACYCLRQGDHVFDSICFVCLLLFVCLLAILLKKLQTDCGEVYGGVRSGKRNKWLKFGGDSDYDPALVQVCTLWWFSTTFNGFRDKKVNHDASPWMCNRHKVECDIGVSNMLRFLKVSACTLNGIIISQLKNWLAGLIDEDPMCSMFILTLCVYHLFVLRNDTWSQLESCIAMLFSVLA